MSGWIQVRKAHQMLGHRLKVVMQQREQSEACDKHQNALCGL
jgi:hypothetical protein